MDLCFPAGCISVMTINKTDRAFRLIYILKGRYKVCRITTRKAKYKLDKVRKRLDQKEFNTWLYMILELGDILVLLSKLMILL